MSICPCPFRACSFFSAAAATLLMTVVAPLTVARAQTPSAEQITATQFSQSYNGKFMVFGPDGNLYLSDLGITKVSPDGTESKLSVPFESAGLAFDKTGDLFAVGTYLQEIAKIKPDGTKSQFVPVADNPSTKSRNGCGWNMVLSCEVRRQPTGLVLDRAGNIYMTNFGAYDLEGYSKSYDIITKITPQGTASTFVPYQKGFDRPAALAIDEADNLYFFYAGGDKIARVTPEGAISSFFDLPAHSYQESGLTLFGGNLYFGYTTKSGQIRVVMIAPNGSVGRTIHVSLPVEASGFNLWGLALDAGGNIYVATNGTPSGIWKLSAR